uniref:Uncharacterized protein n=1 Tax=Anguilla anguilla TaxID=7936 RepID=A0A0E9W3K7_ANGAN
MVALKNSTFSIVAVYPILTQSLSFPLILWLQ